MIAAMRRNEKPIRRVNPSGAVRWVARYTDSEGQRHTAPKPGTFPVKGPCKKPDDAGKCCAQHRIWWAYEQDVKVEKKQTTVREYATRMWLRRHPRGERTEAAYVSRVKAALDMQTDDGPLGDLAMKDVRVRHMDDIVAVMLGQGRTASGARNVLAVLSAMFVDAIRDEVAEMNPAQYATARDSDPRVQAKSRTAVVLSWDDMHRFAACAGEHEPMIRVLSDCGLRLGEMLALECRHVQGDVLVVEQNAWHGRVMPGLKSGESREVPLPPRLGSLLALARRDRIGVLFPGPKGRVWHTTGFYTHVWGPAVERSGMDVRPHDFRHSYVTLLRSQGADPADLAKIAGHTVQTATQKYTHSTGETFGLIRRAVGE